MVCKVSESVKLRTTHFKKCLVSLSCSNSQATVKCSNCLKQFLKIGASVKILLPIQWFLILKLKQVFVQKILLCGMICWGCVTLRDRAPQIAISRIGEHGSKFGKHGEHGKKWQELRKLPVTWKIKFKWQFCPVPSRPWPLRPLWPTWSPWPLTMATMMTLVTVRKLEVVHKEVGGRLISYNLQLSCVRKLEVVWPDVRTLPRRSLWMMNHNSLTQSISRLLMTTYLSSRWL